MRKILIIALIVILVVLGYFAMFNGLNILGLEVLSVFQIKDRSEDLDTQLQKVSTLTSVDQPKAMSELENSAKQLVIAKEEYNNKILYSSKEDIENASQGVQYKMEYLWIKLDHHAKKNGIILKFEIRQSSLGIADQYDLNFTVTGKYVSISEFIAALENDSSLNFKIENFKIVPYEGNTENLQATFLVKDIPIKMDQFTNPNSMVSNEDSAEMQNDNTNTINSNS